MQVFLHGSPDQPPPARQYLIVAPAAHLRGQEVPSHWVDHENKPIQFEVLFVHGTAEVDDEMGRYLLDTKQVMKSRLVLPNTWG